MLSLYFSSMAKTLFIILTGTHCKVHYLFYVFSDDCVHAKVKKKNSSEETEGGSERLKCVSVCAA